MSLKKAQSDWEVILIGFIILIIFLLILFVSNSFFVFAGIILGILLIVLGIIDKLRK